MLTVRFLKKTTIVALGLVLWFNLSPGIAASGQEDPLEAARQLIRDGDYEGAIKLLENYLAVIRRVPGQERNKAEAYYILAKIYFIAGEEEKSDQNLDLCFTTYPDLMIEESDAVFKARVDKAREKAVAAAKELVELEKKEAEERVPEVKLKKGEHKKSKFPIWLVGVGVALVAGAVFLLPKGESSGSSGTPTPPASQYGDISITSDPTGAKVYLDGGDTGKVTNCTLTSISTGTHQLKLVLENYGKWEGSVEVRAGQTTNVTATLAAFKYEFVMKWGSQGSGDGQFARPRGVAVDSSGNVYVSDYNNARIQKFTSNGNFVTKWGKWGTANGMFDGPQGIAVDSSGYVYVAESGGYNHRIQKFTSNGAFVTKWGTRGSGDGQFETPLWITVDNSGYVYVTEVQNNRVQKFTSTGTYVAKWGSKGSGDGQFNYPAGIAIDNSGYVYVVDGNNYRIQKFTSNGVFVAKWGSQGSGDGQFLSMEAVAVDNFGYVLVTDSWLQNRIQKFTSTGKFMTKWGSKGSGDGQFQGPMGVAVDSSGYVYVVDVDNHRIQKFRITTETQLAAKITYSALTRKIFNAPSIGTRFGFGLHPSGSLRFMRPEIKQKPEEKRSGKVER